MSSRDAPCSGFLGGDFLHLDETKHLQRVRGRSEPDQLLSGCPGLERGAGGAVPIGSFL